MSIKFIYSGGFTNDFTYDMFLNSSFASVDAPLTIYRALYDNFLLFPPTPFGNPLPQPAIAGNGGTITTNIFTVSTPSSLPVGTHFGLFTFVGGPSTNANDPKNLSELYTANFQIRNVTPNGEVPEPEPPSGFLHLRFL